MEVDPTSPVSPQPYTILRIKRKRNEEPLDALGKRLGITYLCHRVIKTKTVTESSLRRKKRGGLDVFQFAETVEPEAWGIRAKDLQVCPRFGTSFLCPVFLSFFVSSPQDRISALEREQALKSGTHHDDTPPPPLKRPDLSRQYTVVLDDKSTTPSPTSPSQ
jgi:hypothetical protein